MVLQYLTSSVVDPDLLNVDTDTDPDPAFQVNLDRIRIWIQGF
jgi:hypothetical protein